MDYSTAPSATVDAALRALDAFYITTVADAARLLGMWRHVDTLSPEQRAAVLDHYRPTGRPRSRVLIVIDRSARTGAAWIEVNHG